MKHITLFQAGDRKSVVGVDEARLVYKVGEGPSAGATETKESKNTQSLSDLAANIQAGLMRDAKDKGVEINYEELRTDPNKLCETIEKLSAVWDGLMDKVAAVFAPLGIARSSIDALLRGLGGSAAAEEEEGLVGDVTTDEGEIFDEKDWESARHAKRSLRENTTWMTDIEKASKEHGIPTSTIIAIIEMESSFNPKARPPIDSDTGKRKSNAVGFSQMINRTFTRYRIDALNRGRSEPNRENPADAIDMVAWYCKQLIDEVQALRPEAKYLIDMYNVEHLYMAYHEGPTGYLALRRYLDALADPTMSENKRQAYYELVTATQKDTRSGISRLQHVQVYAKRVAQVARAYDYIKNRDETAERAPDPNLDSPPLSGAMRLTSGFGKRINPVKGHEHDHNGCDYGADAGTPVLAVKDAVVLKVGSDPELNGNFIVLKLKNGFQASYCHLLEPAAHAEGSLKEGDHVSAGEQIGKVGSTGRSTGPHLHFGLKYGGRRIDPEPAIAAIAKKI